MAVKSEAFIALEESLSKRLLLSWQRSSKKVVLRIGNLLQRGEFDKARQVVDEELSMEGVVKRNLPYVEFVMLQSAIYGAARITPIKKVQAFKDGKPPEIKRAAQVLSIAIESLGTESIKAKVHREITKRELAAKERSVQKDEGFSDLLSAHGLSPSHPLATTAYTREFASNVDAQGKAIHDYSSSLHTSRMAQYGFLVEASVTGVTAYRINEQMDNRTCDVCQAMNGRTFPTQFAHAKVEMWLAVENPEDMKSIAPFPKQDAVSVEAIRNASREDLIESGWDTPPFHPLCRGQLDPIVGDIPVETRTPDAGAMTPEEFWRMENFGGSIDEFSNWMKLAYRDYIAELKDVDYNAFASVGAYTGSAYRNVNSMMRGKVTMEELVSSVGAAEARRIVEVSDGLTRALKTASLPHKTQVYRGQRLLDEEAVVGAVVTDAAPMSSSLSKKIADEFASDVKDGFGQRRVVVELTVPKGSKALYVEDMSTHGREKELVLAPGTKYRIDSIEERNTGYVGPHLFVRGTVIGGG